MAVIPVGYAQVNYQFGGPWAPFGAEITMGVKHSVADVSPDTCALNFRGAFVDNVMENLSEDLVLVNVHVKFGPNDVGPEGDSAGSDAGTALPDPESPNVAILVKKRTALGGRANRGRLYLPGATETQVDTGGMLGSDELAAFQSDWNDYLADLESVDYELAVLHGPSSPVTDPTAITSLDVDPRVATLRRRLRP